MLVSMPSFIKPNPALVRTVRLRRPAAQLLRYVSCADYGQLWQDSGSLEA